ncbi:MAG: ferritin-like domain-containing protein [Cocleimonas sp.]|nr:ferritin-like domain-containing protein [Cocleimonas sp.]
MSMNRIQAFWIDQTVAEYNSSARTVNLVHWMQRLAMSPDLIRDALRIADDEMVHAQLCYATAQDAGYSAGLPADQFSLSLNESSDELRYSFLAVLVESYCFGETVAVPLFSAMRQHTQQPSALSVYDQVLKDEPQHAAFGWLTLAWCAAQWGETYDWLTILVPSALLAMKSAYSVDDEGIEALSITEQQWGMMAPQQYHAILLKTAQNTYADRLRHYGISLDKMLESW